MAVTVAEREHRAVARILSEFGFSDTDDVPVSAVLRSALVTLKHRAERAEAARTALRHDLQALITAWLADADALPGSELFDAAENRLRACARDLADRLAREEKK